MKLILAPLAGFTDAPFRLMASDAGADLTYTEMVSAAGLFHGSAPTRLLMETMPGEGPVACQIFGSKVDEIAFAAKEVENTGRFVEINLNAGCPMTKVTRCGAGSKLIENPEKIYTLLKAMVSNVKLPVTLKTRLGPHPEKTQIFEILDAAESAGAKGIIVHARYTSQMHGGAVFLDTLAEVVLRAHIPVFGNGSIIDRASFERFKETGVDGVMIGRASLSNPGIFRQWETGDRIEMCKRHLEYILQFRRILDEKYPHCHIPSEDGYASVKMRTHLFRYFNGLPGAASLRSKLNKVRTLSEIYGIINANGYNRQ